MKTALLIILLIAFVLPASVYAAPCSSDESLTELGCLPNDPIKFSANVYNWGLGLVGGVGLIAIIWGGYLIIVSKGDPLTLNKGKAYIFYALLGIVMAVAGFALYQITAIDILKIPGFGK